LELPGTAAKVLLWFLARRKYARLGKKRSNSIHINNGEIVFPYAEAEKRFAMTRPRFTKSIDNLIQFGFIDINHHGGGMVKDVTTYFISERWEKYGQPEFEQRKRIKDTRGLGFTAKNWEERSGKKRHSKSKPSNETVTTLSNKNVLPLYPLQTHLNPWYKTILIDRYTRKQSGYRYSSNWFNHWSSVCR
jgi:hypothetical protein